MRQRVTFLHRPGDAVDPSTLRITDTSLTGPQDARAAREVRTTLALDELPAELASVLKTSHELHVRWVSPDAFDTVAPLHSRLSPGFHLFFTPRQGGDVSESEALCRLLRKAFGGLENCVSSEESFVALSPDRFSHSAAFQFYQPLHNLTHFARHVGDELCPQGDPLCRAQAARLTEAVSLDLSYDTISHALKVTALSPYQAQPLLVTGHPGHRTEVGLLGEDALPNVEGHEVGLSGHLVVLGQHKEPSVTAFGVPSRHRRHHHPDATFSVSIVQPAGLHPTFRLTLSPAAARPPLPPVGEGAAASSSCAPHAYLVLPRSVFADRYQLSDPLFLASKNLTALRHASGPVDLEAPEYAVGHWGSTALLELAAPPPQSGSQSEWTVQVPLHLRYLAPAARGHRDVQLPHPVVFWACAAEDGTRFPTNPFDRVNLGYDGLFGPRTVFWHVDPSPPHSRLFTTIDVPVLDLDKADWVAPGTAAVVLLGFAWVVWKLVAVAVRGRGASGVSGPSVAESKKTK
ncbi:hypothetical protein RB598_005125 [Gaeumannomyces tritici]